jgi:hypothetical protein
MFEKYLTEAKKVYEFSVGIAGEIPEGFADKFETAMQRYSVASMSAGKKTPITEKPLDFPQLSNTEVTYYEVGVNYPTTPQVLEEYIPMSTGIDRTHVIVRTKEDPRIEYQDQQEGEYEAMLTKEDMGQQDEKAQEKVGTDRVMELLKELETARKEKEYDPIAEVKPADTKDISDEVGSTSPVGSK